MLPDVRTALPGWLSIAVGFAAVSSASALARAAGLHGRLGAAPVLAVAAACCLCSTPGAALCLGGLGWAFATGFVVNRLGELTFHSADLAMFGVSVAGAHAVCTGSALLRVRTVHADSPSLIEEFQRG